MVAEKPANTAISARTGFKQSFKPNPRYPARPARKGRTKRFKKASKMPYFAKFQAFKLL
ncbi:hypothetical protein [uncultured Fibrobacter sp.]|uniref:hypothetical protein n=1 Tax=uncultured Fibrobacter sp. TaxID=261512 RepID=UPI002804208D|nr:hypothetical protein [uncultured Fibrobacter sp.]